MKVVRQRMIKPLNKYISTGKLLFFASFLGSLVACNPTEITGKGVSGSVTSNTDGSLDNKAYIYEDGWYLRAGSNYGPAYPNLTSFLAREAKTITTNTNLSSNCSIPFSPTVISSCVQVHGKDTAEGTAQLTPRNANKTYIFPTHSSEFYQTNMLYHINKGTAKFFEKLDWAYGVVRYSMPSTLPKSIPYYLRNSNLFWFNTTASIENKLYRNSYLNAYADCTFEGNASFSPVGPTLCFGSMAAFPGFYFVQDPSVIYHELGHGFVSIMLNLRNGISSTNYHQLRTDMGRPGYDEAGSVNEGIADYISYVMTKREMVGEWALGRTFSQSRPLTETNALHISALSETSEGRLSYPQYLHYDPNHPEDLVEDVHYAGQIVTHYLVALTKTLKTECSLATATDDGHEMATNYVMMLMAETLSELGDLNARGVDYGNSPQVMAFFNNLNEDSSYFWTTTVNPINYRRFFQTFSKNITKYMPYLCSSFDKNKSEKLLDDYGLLLFKTYNDDGDSTSDRGVTYTDVNPYIPYKSTPTTVSENNRRKSVLVSKSLVELAQKTEANPGRVGYYIIDNSTDIQTLLSNLLFKGFTVPLTKGTAGTEYNNNNIRVSPGEIVGIIPNLLNNSNSAMAGLQILATDWDHVSVDPVTGYFKPCVVDTVTTVDQGGETGGTCTSTVSSYKRSTGTYSAGSYPTDVVAPVCLVQLDEGNSSRWVSQNEFRRKQGLSLVDKDCLGYSTTGTTDTDFTFNPNECLARFLPGASSAQFSKIEPQKTYYESYLKDAKNPSFNPGNILLLEVNKWIPPGTKFRCRMRARFSNCSDCYADSLNSGDDYLDADYNGSKPFKVINFEFEIND